MSIVYRVDENLGVTFVVWDGTVTADQFLAHVRRLIADVNWPPRAGCTSLIFGPHPWTPRSMNRC